jgi:hypothetical protein
MKYLLILFTITFQGQVLHHQMLSSQGQSTRTSSGLLIKQTIGQQSATGNSTQKEYRVVQGFQQGLWASYIASNKVEAVEGIRLVTYPNPFTQMIHFQFSKPISEVIHISIFDILGRLIYEEKKKADTSILSLDLERLPNSEFLVRLSANNFNYYTKILKK